MRALARSLTRSRSLRRTRRRFGKIWAMGFRQARTVIFLENHRVRRRETPVYSVPRVVFILQNNERERDYRPLTPRHGGLLSYRATAPRWDDCGTCVVVMIACSLLVGLVSMLCGDRQRDALRDGETSRRRRARRMPRVICFGLLGAPACWLALAAALPRLGGDAAQTDRQTDRRALIT